MSGPKLRSRVSRNAEIRRWLSGTSKYQAVKFSYPATKAFDAQALVALLRRCRQEQVRGVAGLLHTVQQQSAQRATLFDPATEQDALRQLVAEALASVPAA